MQHGDGAFERGLHFGVATRGEGNLAQWAALDVGIVRSTFVIGTDGNVTKVMRNVKPDTHADDVLAALGATS